VILPNPLDSEGYGGRPVMLKCADYHNEHFVYIDPLFEVDLPKSEKRNFWFGPGDVATHEGQKWDGTQVNMLVCQAYFNNILMYGYGFHVGQEARQWR